MKKYLYSIVFAALILMSTTVVNASNEVYYTNEKNIEMTENEYNNLLGLGFTNKQIAMMDTEEFLNNKDLNGTVISEEQKYIKRSTYMRNGIKITEVSEITEEEAMKEKELQAQNPPAKGPSGNYYNGVVASNVLVVTSRIIGISNTYMRFKVDSEWLTVPSNSERYYDIIGIGMESSKVERTTNLVFSQHWSTTGEPGNTDTVCYPKYTSKGALAVFKLPNGSSIDTLDATLYFNVRKKSGVGTITTLYAAGDYAHAISNVNPNNVLSHLSLNYSSGVIIDTTYSPIYIEMSAAVASFVGTW